MTTVSATPQQMKDRLLQAVDSQSNICNMVVVLEVISCLEKYPITKEALEETRLGKLINDVRKKTKDEDLAKRAKKLLRNWQKLIEPGPAAAPGSTNGSSHPCQGEASPSDISVLGKGVLDVKIRNDVHNTYSPKAEKSSSRKRRMENRDSGVHLPEKLFKMSSYDDFASPPLPTNGIAGSPEDPAEQQPLRSPDRSRLDPLDNDKVSRIPVNAVKPRPSPGAAKLPSTSSLIKAAVMQQQAHLDEGGGAYYQAKSPRGLSTSPRSLKADVVAKRSAAYTPKETPVPSPSSRDSPLSSSQPVASPAQASNADRPPHSSYRSSTHWAGSFDLSSHCSPPDMYSTPEATGTSSASEGSASVSEDVDGAVGPGSEHKRRKYRSRDYSVNLDGQRVEEAAKPVRLKERRLTFDPVTGQIKPLVHKEPSPAEEGSTPSPGPYLHPGEFMQRTESPTHQPYHQTNWKELSRNEIIQSYLNLQSSLLTSSGVQAPGAHFFMSEYLKREGKESANSQVHALQTDSSPEDVPGVTREVSAEDLERIHTQHWPGVNGCYDSKGRWYDWTECISLDPHGDENKLNILPYVCLD
uniref:Mediator of RNA polymerase II transcription subunit 26 n=1 Tax=Tetraodon nigroviridis TaxID=99883 RepID=H3D0G6_TETNG